MARNDDIPLDDRLPGGSHAPTPDRTSNPIVRRAPARGGPVEDHHRRPSDEDEGPSTADLERFGGVTVNCPKCSAELYDDASQCWKCGHALEAESPAAVPTWVTVVAVALLLLVVGWILTRII